MKFLTRNRTGAIATAAILAMTIVGCASDTDEPDNGGTAGDAPATGDTDTDNGADTDTGDAGGEPEVDQLTVAINPSSQFAPIYYGIETGIFEEHGLEIEIVPQTDVAAIVSGVASGQYDFGFATVVHVVTANANGIPIRAVSSIEGQIKPDDEGTVTIASEASGITDYSELEGARLATVGLSSMNTLTTWALAEDAGIDHTTIELVQLPFGQMAAALAAGDVDAAVLQWPFAGDALDDGGVVLGYNNGAMFANTATTLFNTAQSFIDDNPNTVQAFSDAMIESIEGATANEDEARAALVPGLGLTEEQAQEARWNVGGVPYLTMDAFETAQEFLVMFTEEEASRQAIEDLDVTEVVWPGALEYAQ
ncbi:MAG TPA: ABC transporter substrate-binding protein [Actinomycetaceae bacterium]|nr:ABC transporter substrate-binding protein [Actinomycetaceae bacterium]